MRDIERCGFKKLDRTLSNDDLIETSSPYHNLYHKIRGWDQLTDSLLDLLYDELYNEDD